MITDKTRNYDVMQHIRNIYDIIGVEVPSEIESKSISDIIAELRMADNDHTIFVGTKDEYDEQYGNGLIKSNTICFITDDYVPVP